MKDLNVLCPRYRMTIHPKEGTPFNPIHEQANNTISVILDVEVGKRGWINYMVEENIWSNENYWHRIHTSTIEKIEVDNDNLINGIKIYTMNTVYEFVRIT